MLLLIGSDENKLESSVTKRFGHVIYFILYNTETNSFEAIENINEGHNHEKLQQFLDKGVETFIVGNFKPHAFEIINTPKSKVNLTRKISVQQAVDKFLKGD